MGYHEILDPLLLSTKIGFLSTLFNFPGALTMAFLLSRRDFPGKFVLEGCVNLPLVLPPVTLGYLMLLILGRKGIIGSFLFSQWEISIAFSQGAAVLTSMIVSFPLVVRSIRSSLELTNRRLEDAASLLGAGWWDIFVKIIFPQIRGGIVGGAVLGFARSMGEFGATMIFAGNIPGVTRTIPLAVYSKFQIPGREREALILVGFSLFVSLGAMMLSRRLEKAGGFPGEDFGRSPSPLNRKISIKEKNYGSSF